MPTLSSHSYTEEDDEEGRGLYFGWAFEHSNGDTTLLAKEMSYPTGSAFQVGTGNFYVSLSCGPTDADRRQGYLSIDQAGERGCLGPVADLGLAQALFCLSDGLVSYLEPSLGVGQLQVSSS